MTAGRGRRWCRVCRLPASPKDPLYDSVWRNNKTGQLELVSVHISGCNVALTETHSPIEPGGPMPKTTEHDHEDRSPALAEHTAEQDAWQAAEREADDRAANVPGQDVVKAPSTSGQLVEHEAADIPVITSEQVMRYVRYREPLPQFDSDDVARAIALELLDAPTLADAMRPSTLMEAKDLLWQNIVVHGVKWQPSDLAENPKAFPVYAVMDVTVSGAGERALVTCGGLNVVAIMVKADLASEWPVRLRLTTTGTRSGFDTYKVESWSEPADGEPF